LPESHHRMRFPIMAPPRPATVHEVASASESGRRQRRNEDAVAVFALSLPQEDLDIVVLAVSDGLGEHARGTGTSAVAVEAFGDALGGLVGSLQIGPRWQFGVAEIMDAAVAETNAKIRSLPPTSRGLPAATTLTAAVLLGDWLCAVHVGNSRVYRLSGNELEQLTEDHAREPLALLTPPREDMLTINDTGRLASALGVADEATPSVLFRRIAPGDVVLVCSDGLHEPVAGEELARLLSAPGSLDDIATSLIAAANARGGADNVSVCLAHPSYPPFLHPPTRLPAHPLVFHAPSRHPRTRTRPAPAATPETLPPVRSGPAATAAMPPPGSVAGSSPPRPRTIAAPAHPVWGDGS